MEYKYQITFFLSNGEQPKANFGWLNENERNETIRKLKQAYDAKSFFPIEDKNGHVSLINTKHIVEVFISRSSTKKKNN